MKNCCRQKIAESGTIVWMSETVLENISDCIWDIICKTWWRAYLIKKETVSRILLCGEVYTNLYFRKNFLRKDKFVASNFHLNI